jgi:hypothetical protein
MEEHIINFWGVFPVKEWLATFWLQCLIFGAAVGSAILLFLYWRSTQDLTRASLKQATAAEMQASAAKEQLWRTEDIIEMGKKEFEPCIQILYDDSKVVLPILDYEFRGLLLKKIADRYELHFYINYKNLSKGNSYFKIKYNTNVGLCSLNLGSARYNLELSDLRLGIYDYYLLKPNEAIEVPIILRLIESRDSAFSYISTQLNGYLSIQYNIIYKKNMDDLVEIPEQYEESWFLKIDEIKQYNGPPQLLLIGSWQGPRRHIIQG